MLMSEEFDHEFEVDDESLALAAGGNALKMTPSGGVQVVNTPDHVAPLNGGSTINETIYYQINIS